ncbi:Ig-like domain-containing protein [Mucilaginibacter limnophilus]|uniref:Ig-like domain-containing protein n=1 Tax=Mucilaginibacter limnophilus TaxID=1932778 RepID=UPI0013E37FD1|nr:Ig-like domain-containing protein [Mucilaginibacter limnophilus]
MGFTHTTFSQDWKLIQPLYPTTGTFVSRFSVADYGATGDGVTDVTTIFQERLNALGALGGGTLFVPSGKYVIKGTLLIPKGITLRGEWQKPTKGQAINGTILMAYTGRGDENATPFITMETSAAVMDLSIWYPEQTADNITPYSPAIVFGRPNYFGNEYCNAKNITLVNAYSGVVFSRLNGGTCPVINGVYGTPLSRGIEIDNIVDVGRIDWVDFSPAYWAGSGLPGSPASGSAYANWIYQNGTGIVMRRNDWSYANYVTVDGYNKGFHAAPSIPSPGATPNGHNAYMTFKNCKTGIYMEVDNSVGIMFTKVKMENCETGIWAGPKTSGAIQFHSAAIDANDYAIKIEAGSTTRFMMQQSTVTRGKVAALGSTFNVSNNDFNNSAPQITVGTDARSIITGNRFKNTAKIENKSTFQSVIDHAPIGSVKLLPEFPEMVQETHKPARQVLYLVTDAPYNAKADGTTDNTTAIQTAINAAGGAGGGIVFLPPGKYKVLGNLSVPAGVELKGSSDVSTTPTGPGSIIEVYAGKGNASGTPFLKLAANSGIRGITFNYPEQMANLVPDFPAYPYLIQVTGANVYIINVGIRATYNGIDMFTYKCDNHYIDYLAGHAFNNAIKVGGGTANGKILNLQFNTIAYGAGSESKFGSWPNSPVGDNSAIYNYQFDKLNFLELGDTKNEILYNDFIYGAYKGLTLADDNGKGPSGLSMGLGLDGVRKSFNINNISDEGYDLINTQVVSIGDSTTRYISTGSNFKSQVTMYSSDYWGNPGRGINMESGTLNFQMANFQQPGQKDFAQIKNGAKLNIENSAIWPVKLGATGSEKRIAARGSVIDPTGIQEAAAALWENNLTNSWVLLPGGDLDRRDWTATASVNDQSARNMLDSASNRWQTGGSQTNGQYVIVDMKTVNTVTKIILDASGSPGDAPEGFEVYVSIDGTNWGQAVASGSGGGGDLTLIPIDSKKARYIKVVQTKSRSNWWTINEFRVFGKVDVSTIAITPATVTLELNATKQLTATLTPAKATNKKVTWSSNNTSIATVSETGVVTAKAGGKATITARSEDEDKTATMQVTVNGPVSVTGVTLNYATATLSVGMTQQLAATIAPANATDKKVTWRSDNEAVATVNANGLVTAISTGSATIMVTTANGAKTATSLITVTPAVNVADVVISPRDFELIRGNTQQMTIAITPNNATNKAVSYTTGNAAVATVSASGLVTAVGNGTTTITVTTADGAKTATTTITVNPVNVTSIAISPGQVRIEIGSTQQLTTTILPADADNKGVTWSSSNDRVATVSANGLLTGVSAGAAIVTATTNDGNINAVSFISVIPSLPDHDTPQDVVTYPNPVTDGQVKLKFSEAVNGDYIIRLTNMAGQVLNRSTIQVTNGAGVYLLTHRVVPGIYNLELTGSNTKKFVKQIIVR